MSNCQGRFEDETEGSAEKKFEKRMEDLEREVTKVIVEVQSKMNEVCVKVNKMCKDLTGQEVKMEAAEAVINLIGEKVERLEERRKAGKTTDNDSAEESSMKDRASNVRESEQEVWKLFEKPEDRRKMIYIRKGFEYSKGIKLEDWLCGILNKNVKYTWKMTANKNVGKVLFENKADRNDIWTCRKTAKEEGVHMVDELMS